MIRCFVVCVLTASLSCSSSQGTPGSGAAGNGGGSAGASGQSGATGSAGSSAGGTGQAGSSAAGATGARGAFTACGKLLPLQTSASVLQRGKNSQRTAHFVEPSLTVAAVGSAKFGPDTAFNTAAKFSGGIEGVPLFVAGAAPGQGMFIVASKPAKVTAVDEATGATLWSRDLGPTSQPIKSTPVIDAATGTLYVSFGTSAGGDHYEIHALSIANKGAEVAGWPVNASTAKSLNNNDTVGGFDLGRMVQRGALSLVNGILYVPFGGVGGDGGPYKGFVVAINTQTRTTGGWSVGGDRSGMWQTGGLASDGTALFGATGNSNDGNHVDSEEIIRITGTGTAGGKFFPSYWKTWDGGDNDMSSSSPLVMQFSGQCRSLVVAPSKPGHIYLLDPANLGGANGSTALVDFLAATGSKKDGETEEYKVFYAAPTAYISSSGVHVALEARLNAKCPNGDGGDSMMSIKLDMTTTPPTPTVAWCASVSGGEERHHPISTSTDGQENAIVWFVAGGSLKAFDGDTGAALYSGPPCGGFEKQTAMIAANGRIILGSSDGKLCSYSVHP